MENLSFSELMQQAPKEQVEAWYNCSSRLDEEYTSQHKAELRAQKKLVCFDLDGTLSNHRSPIPPANRAILQKICDKYHTVMVGAGNAPRIYGQMEQFPIEIIGNYGMQRSAIVDGELKIVKEMYSDIDKNFFTEQCDYLRKKYGYTEYAGDSVEFHASGMATFALLGTKADREAKIAFDPDRSKRRVMYEEVCDIFKDYTVYIGGSSSFDIAGKRFNKYDAVLDFAHEQGYTKEQVLFVGDDMGDGGGDSHIRLGGIDYIHILDYTRLPEILAFLVEE
ncbi:MAG: HAD family phosphatase [Alistipes sp.]|nr:HAD family phosphatase [Alistipes sp.]